MVVGVKHVGYWFYIDKTDQNTESFFMLLQTFWSISIADSTEQKAAPILTIPVSRQEIIKNITIILVQNS